MRVVLIANRSPWPPNNGATVRQYHILKALKARGDEVHVFGFAEPGEALRSQQEVQSWADSAYVEAFSAPRSRIGALSALLGRARPVSVGYYHSRSMARRIADCLSQGLPDALVVHSSNMIDYVPQGLKARTLLDMADVDSEKFRQYAEDASGPSRWLYRLEGRRLRRYELAAIRDFGATCLVTEREGRVLTELSEQERARKLFAIPNGVDTDFFAPRTEGRPIDRLPEAERPHLEGEGANLVFTGVMNYRPNADAAIHFAHEVLPLVRRSHPDVRFIVVGSRPSPEVLALGRLPGVRVTGFVDDARPFFHAADAYVLPLRVARGIQNKALEAMACGCPIVATPDVAAGVEAVDERQLLVGDAPEEFARQVCRLLQDRGLAGTLGARGRDHVLARYAWNPLMGRLLNVLDGCANRSGSPR